MNRLVPQSLGGQLAVLLVAALLTAHLVSLLAFSGERDRAIAQTVQFGVVDRIAALVEVIDEATPELGSRLAEALSSRRTRLSIAPESSLPPTGMDGAEQNFAEELAEALSLQGVEPLVRFTERDDERPSRRRHAVREVTISIPSAVGAG